MSETKPINPYPGEGREKIFDGVNRLSEQVSGLSDINRRLRRKIFDLYTVFELSRNLSSMLDTKSLIDGFLLTCIGQMGVEGAVIFMADDNSRFLANPRCKGIELADLKNIKIKVDSSISKFLMKSARPLTQLQLLSLLRDYPKEQKLLKKLNARLAAPLIMKNQYNDTMKLLGVLFLSGKVTGADFFDNDLEFLTLLMTQLSVALENAHLYEREQQMNEELQRTQELLVESEKMAALGKLSASIAHEVNNPLGIIKNYLHILSMQKVPEDLYSSYITILKEEVNRIAVIVRGLLDFYRPGQEHVTSVDLRKVIAETLALLTNQLSQSRINVRLYIDKNIPAIQGSPEKLKQVFLNLIMNSRYFMPDGGEITIKAKRNLSQVRIEVSDTGHGIPKQNLPEIFEPFFTTKKEGGTGLGLFVCYGIIQWHQGTISVQNNDDKGVTFHISLPIVRKDESPQ